LPSNHNKHYNNDSGTFCYEVSIVSLFIIHTLMNVTLRWWSVVRCMFKPVRIWWWVATVGWLLLLLLIA
jgi:hypothetical protein